MLQKVTIIDVGLSNTRSVVNAFGYLGAATEVTADPKCVMSADTLVLPGVGSFRQAAERLRRTGLADAIIYSAVDHGRKLLGICLGMQLLGRSGEEDGPTHGLNIIQSHVTPFTHDEVLGRKIPHVGFNSVRAAQTSTLFRGLPDEPDFYFVHSFRMLRTDQDLYTSFTNYGIDFVAAYEYQNIFATQFHPEKSQANGLRLLRNFLKA